jgi:pyridoxamine 5'-phosphate oxidase
MVTQWKNLADIRREYGDLRLSEADIDHCPIQQFRRWFSEILQTETYDPTAMVLATVDNQGNPDCRVVLLKDIDGGAFVFYSNYNSIKAQQIRVNARVALNFYWPSMARQVRVRGTVEYTSDTQSDAYFASRPVESQLSALISPQSAEISSRAELEKALSVLRESNQTPIIRPEHWGGYRVIPTEIEFWQGRDNRLHDRIQYIHNEQSWSFRRLAP